MATSTKRTDNVLGDFLTAAKNGVKKAAQAVRTMSASEIELEVISAGVAPTARLSEVASNPEDLVIGVYITVEGGFGGHALLVLQYDSALKLVDLMMGLPAGSTQRLDAMEESVIQEIGNIVTSSYLTSLSDFYRCDLLPSPPGVAVDMAAAVIDTVLLNTGHFDEETVSIVTRFSGKNISLRGFFLFIPEIVNAADGRAVA